MILSVATLRTIALGVAVLGAALGAVLGAALGVAVLGVALDAVPRCAPVQQRGDNVLTNQRPIMARLGTLTLDTSKSLG